MEGGGNCGYELPEMADLAWLANTGSTSERKTSPSVSGFDGLENCCGVKRNAMKFNVEQFTAIMGMVGGFMFEPCTILAQGHLVQRQLNFCFPLPPALFGWREGLRHAPATEGEFWKVVGTVDMSCLKWQTLLG